MGVRIKLKNKKSSRKGNAHVKISTPGNVKESNHTVDYPTDGSPHSSVRVQFGIRASKPGTYSSAALDVAVELPCNPGSEVEAAEVAVSYVEEILEKHEDDFNATVDGL